MVREILKSRFFEGLAANELRAILAAAKRRFFPARRIVLSQGSPADHFCVLLNGRARHFYTTPDGEKLLLMWLTSGDIFGGASLLPRPFNYMLGTETVRDSEVFIWERDVIRDFAKRYPKLMENALWKASNYLAFYQAMHLALACKTARQRLEQVLRGMAATIGERVAGGIELDVTNEELANAANITPYKASRLMSMWQKKQKLTKGRGKVVLHAQEWLQELDVS